MRVLVVEDEVRMVRLLAHALREEGRAADGPEGCCWVRWVKIYDASGHTERPFGHSDSIPSALAP